MPRRQAGGVGGQQDRIRPARRLDVVGAQRVAVSDVDPEPCPFAEPLQRGGMKLPRIGTIGASPTRVGHRHMVRGRNALGQQAVGGGFDHRVDHGSQAAHARHHVELPPPGAEIARPLVGQNLRHDSAKLLGRRGREAAHGQLGPWLGVAIVAQVGIGIVGGDLRLGAPVDIDPGLGVMDRHAACQRRGVAAADGRGIANQDHEPQPAALGDFADLSAELLGRCSSREDNDLVSLGGAEFDPGAECLAELGRADHYGIGGVVERAAGFTPAVGAAASACAAIAKNNNTADARNSLFLMGQDLLCRKTAWLPSKPAGSLPDGVSSANRDWRDGRRRQ